MLGIFQVTIHRSIYSSVCLFYFLPCSLLHMSTFMRRKANVFADERFVTDYACRTHIKHTHTTQHMTTTTTTTIICTAWVQCPAIISRFYLPRNKNLMQWEKRKTAKKRKPKKREQGKSLWTVIGKLVVWVGTAAGQLKLNLVAAHKIYDLLLFQLSAHITTPPPSLPPT